MEMKKKILISCLIIILTLLLPGCAESKNQNAQQPSGQNIQPKIENNTGAQPQDQEPKQNSNTTSGTTADHRASIGGIHLDDLISKYDAELGKDYKETTPEEAGHFPETYNQRDYAKGISLFYGKESKKVFEVRTTSADFPTDLGVKVGDKAGNIFQIYNANYKKFQSPYSEGDLVGFYTLDDGTLVIFDFDKNDGSIVNHDVTPNSKVESIILTKTDYVD